MEEIELLVDGVHAEPAQLDGEVGGDGLVVGGVSQARLWKGLNIFLLVKDGVDKS